MQKQRNRFMRVAFVATAATLLSSTAFLRAQENEEAESAKLEATAAVATQKVAIELGAPFCDDAVLQREMKVPVWGWSKPGVEVTVEFAGQKKSAKAGTDGNPSSPKGSAVARWTVWLDPMKASFEPATMTITESSGKTVTLKNILVGEVWMASGQSNMQWKPVKCDVALLLKRIAERVAAGKEKQPVIREFVVDSVCSALHPVEHATGAWKNGNFEEYSAIATAFAYELYKELGVPIGIMNCSFSMTSVRAWTPRCGFRDGKDEQTREIYKTILESDPSTPEHKTAWEKFYKDTEATISRNAELVKNGKPAEAISTKTPGNLADNRDATWMFNGRMRPVVPYAIRGAIWNQCYSSMFEGVNYYDRLHALIRGWREVWGQGDFPVYFHQLYAPGANDGLTLNDMGEMRLGFWLARDIPNVGMASQIDIQGAIHYSDKALPGKRLALHALKNQYGKKIVVDGPMFKSYTVKGDKLIVELEHTDGGLLVGQAIPAKTIDGPTKIENGEEKVTLFYLAGKDRVWHRAKVKIVGEKLELAAAGVTEPRGVAYGCNGIGGLPNIYNSAMLPLTPFIYYDNKLVTSKDWPDTPIKVDGVKLDLSTVGTVYEYRKMPLLSSIFVHNAVLQADQPLTIWGSAVHDWGYEAKGKAEIQFSFAGVEKTIPVTPGMKEWSVTLPPMPANAEPKTLKVTFTIDGKLAHERVCTNVVLGDVWYVGAPSVEKKSNKKEVSTEKGNPLVRMMTRKSKSDRRTNGPLRFTVSVSSTPENKYASLWENATGFPGQLGEKMAAKTGKPVGLVYMQTMAPGKDATDPELKNWMNLLAVAKVPSLKDDYTQLTSMIPGTLAYEENAHRYLNAWKKYWGEYIPALIKTKAAPDGAAWGSYPSLKAMVKTDATDVWNTMGASFMPGNFKGMIFVTSQKTALADGGVNFGEHLSALANGWKEGFACPDPWFIYTVPGKTLAPKLTAPQAIKGQSASVEISDWSEPAVQKAVIEKVMGTVYP